jgi:hypothetical protein
MTYDPTSPNGLQSPKDQVTQVRTNFAQFASILAINHTGFNLTNQGDHEAVVLNNQSVDPGVTQDLDVIYCKNATSNLGTQPQIFLQIPKFLPTELDPTNAINAPMQLTYNQVNVAGPVFQSFLPGGYLFYFGTVSALGTVTLSPAPTKILMAIANSNNLTGGSAPAPFDVQTRITSNSTFVISSALATGIFTFTWMAIASA